MIGPTDGPAATGNASSFSRAPRHDSTDMRSTTRKDALALMSMTQRTTRTTNDDRFALRTVRLGLLALGSACVLGGCSSSPRPDGPPQARAYAPMVWQATPPALNEPRVARDGR